MHGSHRPVADSFGGDAQLQRNQTSLSDEVIEKVFPIESQRVQWAAQD